MNKISTIIILLFIAVFTQAQITTPAASPGCKVEQKVGLSTFTVDYSRPSAKGRVIFGDNGLVPYGKLWRTGANSITKISFSDEVIIGGQNLKKGDYGILAKPNAKTWDVNFYAYDGTNWSAYTEKTPVATVSIAVVKKADNIETFTMGFSDLSTNGAKLGIEWEKTSIQIPITVEVDKTVMANIEKVMAGPTTNDYYNAAAYYHDSGKDLNKALEWIQRANSGENPRFWQVRREALILADLGRTTEAIAAAQKSLELSKVANNEDYIKMNETSIAEWSMKKK